MKKTLTIIIAALLCAAGNLNADALHDRLDANAGRVRINPLIEVHPFNFTFEGKPYTTLKIKDVYWDKIHIILAPGEVGPSHIPWDALPMDVKWKLKEAHDKAVAEHNAKPLKR